MGPVLDRVELASFEAGANIELFGSDLHGADIEVALGDQVLTIVERRPDRLRVTVEGTPGTPIASGTSLSAGEWASCAVAVADPCDRAAPAGPAAADGDRRHARRRRPAGQRAAARPRTARPATDDVVVALYRDGATARLFDAVGSSSKPEPDRRARRHCSQACPAGVPGDRRVNDQQALQPAGDAALKARR